MVTMTMTDKILITDCTQWYLKIIMRDCTECTYNNNTTKGELYYTWLLLTAPTFDNNNKHIEYRCHKPACRRILQSWQQSIVTKLPLCHVIT